MAASPIVVGIDGSPEAREALRWAVRLASVGPGEIMAVHALGLLETLDGQLVSADNHRARIEELVERDWCAGVGFEGRPVRAVVCEGDPVDVLVEVAVEQGASLVIVASRGAGASPALTLGSTSLHLALESPVPVLIVPEPSHAVRHLALQRILVAVDGTPGASVAVELAADLAARLGAQVELVRAVEEMSVFPLGPAARATTAAEEAAPDWARRDTEAHRRRLRQQGVPVHVTVERGEPDEVIRQVAARIDADLIVVATHRTGQRSEDLLASVSRRIVHVAHRPTLVVPVSASVASAGS
jgi:nucleotide-binding universal stress UspA family protein